MSNETEVGITANAQPFTREMDRAAQAAMTTGQRIQSAFREAGANASKEMTGAMDRINAATRSSMDAMEKYKGAIAAVGVMAGVFAGIVVAAKRFTDATYDATYAAELLGTKLGISATQADLLATTLNNMQSDTRMLEEGLAKVTQTLGTNEAAFTKLGIATRDSNGDFRSSLDILTDTNARLLEFREGTDRNIEMQRIYGRTWKDLVPLLYLTKDAMAETQATAQSLGLVIGEESVAAAADYNNAMDQSAMVLRGMGKAIGDALMPMLSTLGEWFSSIGPAAVTTIKGALGGLMTTFWGLKNGVVVVFETINAVVISIAEPFRAVAAAMWKMVQGDFKGAATELSRGGQTMVNAWKGALKEIEASSSDTAAKIWTLFATPTPMAPVSGAGDAATPDGKKDKAPKAAGGKQMSDAAWAMEEAAHLARTYHQLGEERAAAEEASFERAMKAAEEWEADLERGTKAAAEAAKRAAEQRTQVELLWAQNAAAAQLATIDAAESRARHAVDLGTMTTEELLGQEAEFELQRNAIRAQALLDRLATVDPEKDPVVYAQILVTIQELERQHQAKMGEIRLQSARQSAAPMMNVFSTLEQGMVKLGTTMLTSWRNVGSALRSVLASIGQSIIQEVIVKPLVAKIAAFAKERALTMMGIGADAAKAGSGAAASQASIPYIGPILALAAMAAVFAAVSGMSGKVSSAAGGYDIPAGLNPLTQLHAEEMVLPAKYADVIRGLAGEERSSQEAAPLHIHARSDADVVRVGDLKRLLQGMRRDFVSIKS